MQYSIKGKYLLSSNTHKQIIVSLSAMPFDDYATSESFDTSTVASDDKVSVQRFLAHEQVSEEGSGVFVLDEVSEADIPNDRYGDDSKHIVGKSKSKTATKARSSKRLPSTQQVSTKRAAKR